MNSNKYQASVQKKAAMLQANSIDYVMMSKIVGERVMKPHFHLEEDLSKDLAPGVIWRRRRFRFRLASEAETSEEANYVGLCINEITVDANAEAELRPTSAAEFPGLMEFSEVENAYWQTCWATGAIRGGRGTRESRLFLNMAPILLGEGDDRKDLILKFQSVSDLKSFDEASVEEAKELCPVYLEADVDNFSVVRYLPAFPPSRLVQSSAAIVAATNAGYFLNFPEEYDDGFSALHQPVGGHMADGKLFAPAWTERPGFCGLESGEVVSRLFGPEDMVLRLPSGEKVELHRLKGTQPQHGSVLRHFDPQPTTVADGLLQLSFSGPALVTVTEGTTPAKPPLGGAIVFLDKQIVGSLALDADVVVELSLKEASSARWLMCSSPFLVKDGEAVSSNLILTEGNAGEFRPEGPAPTRFPYDSDKTKAPRTAMGLMPSGGTKLVVVDGRKSREHSLGADLAGMAALMQAIGCDTAINLDGGGSSVLAIEGYEAEDRLQDHLAHGVVNVPSDDGGRERIVPVLLAVKRTTT